MTLSVTKINFINKLKFKILSSPAQSVQTESDQHKHSLRLNMLLYHRLMSLYQNNMDLYY